MTNQMDMIKTPDTETVSPWMNFSYELTECVESVGVGLVSTARAQPLVPAPFVLLNAGEPVTPLVVLALQCQGIAVADAAPRPGIVVQIGLLIVPPDGTGEINTVSLWHFTNHSLLARTLHGVGLATQHVPTIRYDVALGGKLSSAHIRVPAPAMPALTLTGSISEPSQPRAFVGNWWARGSQGLLKLNTQVPQALLGEARLRLTTEAASPLGQLIGGDTLEFAVLQHFNTFPLVSTHVSIVAG